jgi:hypothetical protein
MAGKRSFILTIPNNPEPESTETEEDLTNKITTKTKKKRRSKKK